MVDELNRHITKNNRHPTSRGCKTGKREPTQSTLAKLMKALFEMDRILQEKDGKGKTPLFVGPEGGGGRALPYSHIGMCRLIEYGFGAVLV